MEGRISSVDTDQANVGLVAQDLPEDNLVMPQSGETGGADSMLPTAVSESDTGGATGGGQGLEGATEGTQANASSSIDVKLWKNRIVLLGTIAWAYIDIGLDGVNGYKLWKRRDYYWSLFMFSMLFIPNAITWAFLRANGMASCSDLFVLMSQLGPIRELIKSWETGKATPSFVWFVVAEGLGEATFTGVLNGYILTFGSETPGPIQLPYTPYEVHLPMNTFYIGFYTSLLTITKTALRLNFYGREEHDISHWELFSEFFTRLPLITLRISTLACFGYLMRSNCAEEDNLASSTQLELPSALFVSLCTLMCIIYAVEPSVSISICSYFGMTMLFTTPMRFLSCFNRIHDTIANLRILETLTLVAFAYNPLDPNPRMEMLWENADLLVYTVMVSFVVVILTRIFAHICSMFTTCQSYGESLEGYVAVAMADGQEEEGFHSMRSSAVAVDPRSRKSITLLARAQAVKQRMHMAISSGDIMMTSLLVQLEGASLQDPYVVKNAPNVFKEEFQNKLVDMGMPRDARALKNMSCDLIEFKQAEYTIQELREFDFTIADLKTAGFDIEEMKEGEISASDLKEAGYVYEQLKMAGYPEEEIKAAGLLNPEDPRDGDEMLVLPGVTFWSGGKEYYKTDDKGKVVKEVYRDEGTGEDKFEIVWYRTGLTSTMKYAVWKKYFKRIARLAQKELQKGDEVQAIQDFSTGGKDYYRIGDKGRVTKDKYTEEKDGIERIEVTWYRSGLTSTMKAGMWMKNFKFTDENEVDDVLKKKQSELASLRKQMEDGTYVKKKREIKTVAVIGDEVESLPGSELTASGKDYYKGGDRGVVCKDVYVTESDQISRFEVVWYRSGLVSTMKAELWLKNFKFVGSVTPTPPKVGAEVEALPLAKLEVDSKDYYKGGDRGIVCKDVYTTESDGLQRFEVVWYRTGLVSTMKVEPWIKNFKVVSATTKTVAEKGDEMVCLPTKGLTVEGKVYYDDGDVGRVWKDTYVTESDGISRFEVTWYRTGLTSTMKTDVWIKNFRYTGSSKLDPVVGDEMETLPAIKFSTDDKEYYAPGDKGRVCKDVAVTESDNISRFEVKWYRTGLTSTMKTDLWIKNFKWCGFDPVPSAGDRVMALKGISFSIEDKEYYKEGDIGNVSKSEFGNASGEMIFEIYWPRTKLTSTMKSARWAANFTMVT